MSDLSISRDALERGTSQLSVDAYFDEALYRREMDLLFQPGPRYVGHSLCVPEPGDFHVLGHEGDGRALIRNPREVELVSNVCRHRQAVMLRGRGHLNGHLVCPLHRWTYDLEGRLVGAPHFEHDPCLNLERFALTQWNGLLFESAGRDPLADLTPLQGGADLDFTGYRYDSSIVHECDYNWKTFIEVYLEDYHVGPFHPGLGNFVTCEDLRWEMGAEFSVQTVGVARSGNQALGKAGSPVYRAWQDQVMRYQQGRPPRQGAVWLTYYPGLMVEWYPNVLVVSTLYPKGPRRTTNIVEFFYPEEIQAFEREYVQAQQAAYMETCIEDDEIALRMDAGREALLRRGADEVGPYQSPMEDGMQHFHEWYRARMDTAR
jgi:choline monooxygenase